MPTSREQLEASLATSHDDAERIALLGRLATLLHESGDDEKAFERLEAHATLLATHYTQERERVVAEMKERFEMERAARERETFRLKSEHLEAMMEQRSRELTSMAMHLVHKNTFLQKFRRDILRIASDHPEAGAEVMNILAAIDKNVEEENDWQRFEQEFQSVHGDFLRTISERCPQLSPAELKVCALLKINLSNKDITRLLSVSLRNVESHRYSIRRKLGLPGNANLTMFLAGV